MKKKSITLRREVQDVDGENLRVSVLEHLAKCDINTRFNIKKRYNNGRVLDFKDSTDAYATRDRAVTEISEANMRPMSTITLIEII